MATLSSNSMFGRISGKVGDRVYSSWKGIPYVRAKAVNIHNPKTAAQQDQRAKFAAIVKFLQPLTVFLRVGFKSKNITMSPFNAAMSYNFKNALTGIFPNYSIDYSQARVSQGNLPGAINPAASFISPGAIKFTWDDNRKAMADDRVLLVVYNPAKLQVATIEGGNMRMEESQTIALPSTFLGDEVYCYIGFQNQRQTISSDSQFIGSILV